MKKLVKGFIWKSKSWLWDTKNKNDFVQFGLFNEDVSSICSISIEWVPLSKSNKTLVIRDIYDGGWDILTKMSDIFKKVSTNYKDITPQEFINLLLSEKFTDFTQYNAPKIIRSKSESLIEDYLMNRFKDVPMGKWLSVIDIFNELDFYHFEELEDGFMLYCRHEMLSELGFRFGQTNLFSEFTEIIRVDFEINTYYELIFKWKV